MNFSTFHKLFNLVGGVRAKRNSVTGVSTFSAGAASVSVNPIDQGISTYPEAITSPDQLSGLILWLDAQQPVYKAAYSGVCTTLGDQVVIWPDASGLGNLPTASATKPTFDPTGLNGLPAIQFNSNSNFTTPGILTAGMGNAATMFAVTKSTGTHTDLRIVFGTQSPGFYVGINGGTLVPDLTFTGITGWTGANAGLTKDGIIGVKIGASSSKFEKDQLFSIGLGGSQIASDKATSGAIAWANTAMTVGSYGAGFYWPGLIGEVLVFNRALSDSEFRQVYEYLSIKWRYTQSLVVCAGNSLTSGFGSTGGSTQNLSLTGTNYPSRLMSELGTAYKVRTDAYPGRTTSQMLSESTLYSDLLIARGGSGKNIIIVWEITNTLVQSLSRGAAISQLLRYCKARRAAGYKVIVGTCLNRGGAVYAGFSEDYSAINAYIRANFTSFADGIADVAADSRLQTTSNLTYFDADAVHLTNAGYQVVADICAAAVRAVS